MCSFWCVSFFVVKSGVDSSYSADCQWMQICFASLIKVILLSQYYQLIMNHIKYHINSQFLGCKMATTILSDWKAHPISNLSEVDSNTYLITDQKSIPSQTHKFKTVIKVTDAGMNPVHILALSGQLPTFGQQSSQPFYPKYLVQMIVANCIAILLLQLEANKGEKKEHIYPLSCVECVKYFGAFNISAAVNQFITGKRGTNLLDGGAPFYRFFKCKEGLLSVGNLQPKFYAEMASNIGLSKDEENYLLQNQLSFDQYPKMHKLLENKFKQQTAEYWEKLLNDKDTCVMAVRSPFKIDKNYVHPFLMRPKL